MTRPEEPRLAPVDPHEYDEIQAEVMAPLLEFAEHPMNIFGTLLHHPQLLRRWRVFGNHVLFKSSLPARDRELLILRTAWNCRAEYEWGHHVRIGREAELSDEDIQRVTRGPDVPGWSDHEHTLLEAADELHDDSCLAGDTWAALHERYSTEQVIDVVFTVGQYHLVSMALNSLGVQREDGVPGFPAEG
jgi:alkylhydroperoxidase family enzyme